MALRLDIHLQNAEPLKGNTKAREGWITFIKTSRGCGCIFSYVLISFCLASNEGRNFTGTLNNHRSPAWIFLVFIVYRQGWNYHLPHAAKIKWWKEMLSVFELNHMVQQATSVKCLQRVKLKQTDSAFAWCRTQIKGTMCVELEHFGTP